MHETDPFLSLTPRENTVVSLILSGMTNREIADRLGSTEATIKIAVSVILKKTGTRSRTHLIARAFAEAGSVAQRQTHVSYGTRKGQATGRQPADPDAENQGMTLPGPAAAQGFTEREKQVVGMILEGMTNAEIASALGLRKRTIMREVSTILKKAGARSRAQLATKVLSSRDSVQSNLTRALYHVRGQNR
jgi:DNA-binding NarL/FixJ family response regulator